MFTFIFNTPKNKARKGLKLTTTAGTSVVSPCKRDARVRFDLQSKDNINRTQVNPLTPNKESTDRIQTVKLEYPKLIQSPNTIKDITLHNYNFNDSSTKPNISK